MKPDIDTTKIKNPVRAAAGNRQRGIAALPVVLSLTALIMIIGALMSISSFTDNQSSDNLADSERALAAAQLGARDALERIARDHVYSGGYQIALHDNGCNSPYDGCATVGVDAGGSHKIASSSGQVGEFIRKIKIDVYLDSNGRIDNYSWQEF